MVSFLHEAFIIITQQHARVRESKRERKRVDFFFFVLLFM